MSNINKLEELFEGADTLEEQVEVVNKLGVFTVRLISKDTMTVMTSMTVSKVNYKTLMKMNGGKYMKVIDFTAKPTFQHIVFLADISLKTNKYSQDALNTIKKARFDGKYKGRPTSSKSYSNDDTALDHWMDVVGYPPSREELAVFKRSLQK